MYQRIAVMAREAFWQHAEEARNRGKDLAEVLDREGYLLTPERLVKIQADTIDEIADLLETTRPTQWADNRPGLTPLDLQRGMAERLRLLAKDRRGWKP